MKNNLFLGVFLGLIFPLLAQLTVLYTHVQTSLFAHKPIAIYVIAAALNLIGVRFLYRGGKEKTANGVILATFLAMIVLIILQRQMVFSYT